MYIICISVLKLHSFVSLSVCLSLCVSYALLSFEGFYLIIAIAFWPVAHIHTYLIFQKWERTRMRRRCCCQWKYTHSLLYRNLAVMNIIYYVRRRKFYVISCAHYVYILLEATPLAFALKLPSTFMCHIFFEKWTTYNTLWVCECLLYKVYIYSGTHIFALDVHSWASSFRFFCGSFHFISFTLSLLLFVFSYTGGSCLTPRNAIILYVIWNDWQKWTF